MTLVTEDVLKLVLAILIGGLIGAEREFRDKAVGFRTIIFICVGATLFTMFSLKIGGDEDPVRIAASIVSGVGFLGAGAILRDSGRVVGLTTASTIWLAAGVGMGIGGGEYLVAVAATVAISIVLWAFPVIEKWIDDIRHAKVYEVLCPVDLDTFQQIEALFLDSGLRLTDCNRNKSGDRMLCTWHTLGKPDNHEQLVEKLLTHTDVLEFRC